VSAERADFVDRVGNYCSLLLLLFSLEMLDQRHDPWFSAVVAEQRATTSSFI
jgi:hypothetical protein